MEENQIQSEFQNSQDSFNQYSEPEISDNFEPENNEYFDSMSQYDDSNLGQSFEQDPNNELILGKFKSVEELSKAYEELERYQGRCSEELGILRKNSYAQNELQRSFEKLQELSRGFTTRIQQDMSKYNRPEYFQDPSFKEMYKEAFYALGENLDTDRFVNLLEGYVTSRIIAENKKRAAQNETQRALDAMGYENNSKASFTPPKKSFDQMSEKEIDELLDRLI